MNDEEWLSAIEVSRRLGINPGTVSNIVKRTGIPTKKLSYRDVRYPLSKLKSALSVSVPNQFNRRFVNPIDTKSFIDYWKLDWDEFICCADMHVPLIDEHIFDRMLTIADKWKIKNFIHAGDFFNQDQFSQFDTYHEDITEWAEELESAKSVYKTLHKTFTEVKFFMGSHDLRLWKLLNHSGKATKFNSAYLQAEIPGRDTSRYRYAQIGDEWHLTHPRNVLRVNTAPALRLGAKYQRSIVFGHGHWWGIYRDPSATHYQVAPGCMTDYRRHAYCSLWDTSHDRWTPGFLVVVERNKPILLAHDSPWEIYIRNNGTKQGKKV